MKIKTMYFSPTGTTEKIVNYTALKLSHALDVSVEEVNNITLKKNRLDEINFDVEDIVIAGVPVYAGRVPNVLLKYLAKITSKDSKCIAYVTYGNRNFDDGLIEFTDILTEHGFNVIGCGAVVAEHSFSENIATGRPDECDFDKIDNFILSCIEELKCDNNENSSKVNVEGHKPYRGYYKPRDENGEAVNFISIKPVTSHNCTNCGACSENCPMGSINKDDPSLVTGPCIKCCRCVRLCPVDAKKFDSEDFLRHKNELEIGLIHRNEPIFFL